jgi:hypothetical protein
MPASSASIQRYEAVPVGSRARSANRSLLVLAALIGLPQTVASTPSGECDVSGAAFARVRFVESVLTDERPGEEEALPISVNFPVADGDRIGTGDGRAAIDLANSSRVDLDTNTRLEFRTLTDASNSAARATVLVLECGTVRLDVGDSAILDGRFEILTPAGSIDLLSAGSFLVDHRGGVTGLGTIHGAAELSGDEGSVLLRSGQRSTLGSERTPSEPQRWMAPSADEFVLLHDLRLSAEADRDDEGSGRDSLPEAVRPFAGELAAYGTWSILPKFGRVWRPATTGAWSPYSRGYWSWGRVGWVWVSSDPWGWAPYHYGRWNYTASQGWFWIPGAVWGGAWVAFAVGPTQVGWCPLDFWNRPVIQERSDSSRMFPSAGLLEVHGWQFVAADQFAARGPDHPPYQRSDRLPRAMVVAITGVLPPIRHPATAKPGAAAWLDQARASLTAIPIPGTFGSQPQSFRALEPATISRRPQAHGRRAPRPGAPPGPRTSATGSAGLEPLPADGRPGNPAVDRLIGGTRPPGTPPPGVTPPPARDRQDGSSNAAPRSRAKTATRPPQRREDEPKPPPDDQNN